MNTEKATDGGAEMVEDERVRKETKETTPRAHVCVDVGTCVECWYHEV